MPERHLGAKVDPRPRAVAGRVTGARLPPEELPNKVRVSPPWMGARRHPAWGSTCGVAPWGTPRGRGSSDPDRAIFGFKGPQAPLVLCERMVRVLPATKRLPLAFVNETRHITITSLATQTAVRSTAALVLTEDFFLKSIDVVITYSGGATGDEVVVVLADGDYGVAELTEVLNQNGPTGRGDKIAIERAHRNIRFVASVGFDSPTPNMGLPIRVNVVSLFKEGNGWRFAAYNPSGSAVSGTAGIVDLTSKAFGNWKGG